MAIDYNQIFDGVIGKPRREPSITLVRTLLPAIEPVSTTECKMQAKITNSDEDALVQSMIIAARLWAEAYTERAFITQGWRLGIDIDIPDIINVPIRGLKSVESIVGYMTDNSPATVSPASYFVDTAGDRICLNYGDSWGDDLRRIDSLVIKFTAGYSSTPSDVPEAIRQAIRECVAYSFDHRGDEKEIGDLKAIGKSISKFPGSAISLLDPFSCVRF